MHEGWGRFFRSEGEEQIDKYEDTVRVALNDPSYSANHLRDLHKLGYLPVKQRDPATGKLSPERSADGPGSCRDQSVLLTKEQAELVKQALDKILSTVA